MNWELIGGLIGGILTGFAGSFAFMNIVIDRAIARFETSLTDKFDQRYVLLPQRHER